MSAYRRFIKRCAYGVYSAIDNASLAAGSLSRSLSDLALDAREVIGATSRIAALLEEKKHLSEENGRLREMNHELKKETESIDAARYEIRRDRDATNRLNSEWEKKMAMAKRESFTVLSDTIRTLLIHTIYSDLKLESDLIVADRIALSARVFGHHLATVLGPKHERIVTVYRHDLSGNRYEIELPGGRVSVLQGREEAR